MHPNDPRLRSFVEVEPSSDFPIQNLPYGVFFTPERPVLRAGVAIGDQVLDLAMLEAEGLIRFEAAREVFARPSLNAFMALGAGVGADPGAHQRAAAPRQSRAARQRGAAPACAAASGAGAASHADRGRGLHRFLFVEGARRQCRCHVPRQGQSAAAELALHAGRLQRPRLHGGGRRHADPPPVRSVEIAGCAGAALRSVPAARFRTGDGGV